MSDSQIILAVDDSGNFLEYIPKELGHTGEGKRHLAIAVLLFNSKGQVLLQKRKHKIFDNIWDITGATHPLHKSHPCHSERSEESVSIKIATSPASPDPRNDGKCKICNKDNVDEALEEATWRCLAVEYRIKEKIPLKNLGFFNYFKRYGEFCENEHCAMIVGEYNGEVNLSQDVGYEYKWMDKEVFLKDIESDPKRYTPWAVAGITAYPLVY